MAIPKAEIAISLPTEELAGHLVMHHKTTGTFHVYNELLDSKLNPGSLNSSLGPPLDYKILEKYKEALVEAYSWAFTEGLFVWDPDRMDGNWWRVSRRGQQLDTPVDVLQLGFRDILPPAFLHPIIAKHAAPIFRSGEYDAAVFVAFKQVEIFVRELTGLPDTDGDKLMKAAFNATDGRINSLTNQSERQGLMFVFAGALQLFRNSTGHQNLVISPQEAAHLLIHASYLLSLAEQHSTKSKAALQVAPP